VITTRRIALISSISVNYISLKRYSEPKMRSPQKKQTQKRYKHMKKKYTTPDELRAPQISGAEKILLALLPASHPREPGQTITSRSFNELRNKPFNINPVTLSRNLRKLINQGLVTQQKRKVRGGTQHRYSATQQGIEYLASPKQNLKTLDQEIIKIIGLNEYMKSDIKSQDLGRELLTNPKQPHRLSISAKLETTEETIELEASLQASSSGKITCQQVISRVSSHPAKTDKT
jgi:DNA-binding PadR family transcriptional regulator